MARRAIYNEPSVKLLSIFEKQIHLIHVKTKNKLDNFKHWKLENINKFKIIPSGLVFVVLVVFYTLVDKLAQKSTNIKLVY